MSQLKKGAILSYITIFLTNIIGLALTPFIIKSLGNAEYGLYMLIGAFVGYISVLDLGLNNTIVRFVAKYRAEGDKKGEENFLATTMWIYGILSLIIGFLGVILYFNLENIFGDSLTAGELSKAKIMFIILIFNLAITLPGGAFTAVCSGYEHFVFPRFVNIIRYLIRSLMVVVILLWGKDAIGLVILDTVMNILVIFFNGYYALKKLNVKFKLHFFHISLVKQIFSYSIWIFVFALVGQFQWKAGQVVLGALTNTTLVAIYAVGITLGTYYGAFSTAISGVFLPRATKMSVNNADGMELTEMMVRIGRISFLVLLLVLGGFILYGQQFIYLWVGDTYKDAWLIALIIMIAYTIPLVQSFGNLILEAKSLLSFKAIVYISCIGIGTLAGAFMVENYGISGMISGTTAGWMISVAIMNIYYHKVISLNIPYFLKNLFSRTIPTFALILIVGFFIEKIPGTGWINFGIKITLFAIVYSVLMFFLGMRETEKQLIKNTIPF